MSNLFDLGSVGNVDAALEVMRANTTIHRKLSTEQSASDFEAMFVAKMLEPMFGESTQDGLLSDPATDDIYRSWLVDASAKSIVKAGGLGIAEHVQKQLLQLQQMPEAHAETSHPITSSGEL